tara:strand:- start:81 stop:203 length:123 start_codon:yes stop_codon:yes gene_type:complete
MKRVNELLFIRNEDNKIEIEAEIYHIRILNKGSNEESNYT